MKIYLFISALFFCLYATAQPDWKCIYTDSTFLINPDVMTKIYADALKENNVPGKMIDSAVEKFKGTPLFNVKTKYVIAGADSTLIDIEVSDKSTLRVDERDEMELLLKKDEIYFRSRSGSYDSLLKVPRKVYKLSGRQPVFLNYTCKEYISSDSSCIIWVAEDLPSYINPGIRTGGVKGAVLFYEFKKDILVTRCRMTKLMPQGKKI